MIRYQYFLLISILCALLSQCAAELQGTSDVEQRAIEGGQVPLKKQGNSTVFLLYKPRSPLLADKDTSVSSPAFNGLTDDTGFSIDSFCKGVIVSKTLSTARVLALDTCLAELVRKTKGFIGGAGDAFLNPTLDTHRDELATFWSNIGVGFGANIPFDRKIAEVKRAYWHPDTLYQGYIGRQQSILEHKIHQARPVVLEIDRSALPWGKGYDVASLLKDHVVPFPAKGSFTHQHCGYQVFGHSPLSEAPVTRKVAEVCAYNLADAVLSNNKNPNNEVSYKDEPDPELYHLYPTFVPHNGALGIGDYGAPVFLSNRFLGDRLSEVDNRLVALVLKGSVLDSTRYSSVDTFPIPRGQYHRINLAYGVPYVSLALEPYRKFINKPEDHLPAWQNEESAE